MEWVLQSPQIHSTFSNLGYAYSEGYYVNENCNAALENILHNILTEDKYLRNYRRNISFGQNIKKDLIPLLINTKEEKSVKLLIQIFVNLTTPIECLFNVEDISKSEFGRQTVFELNNLLTTTKAALTDQRATKVIIEFLKKNVDYDSKKNISTEQRYNIGNTLLFLRNILHIPDDVNNVNPNYNGPSYTVQNQIMWNLFSQSIDKVLIKLMRVPDAGNWGVTMVQLVALLYKDQHVTTLHKLLNIWLETSLSESSEDNESNTSPPNRGRDGSSPMVTSEPTSDSSDTGASGKCGDKSNSGNVEWDNNQSAPNENSNQTTSMPAPNKVSDMDCSNENKTKHETANSNQKSSSESNITTDKIPQSDSTNIEKKTTGVENSECAYGTQIENRAFITTSSNEDDLLTDKQAQQKQQNAKQRVNNKSRPSITTLQEKRRKKVVKRGKSNIINVQGLTHKSPTDDDISNVMKEFTVDFLLKGYNSLVKTLYEQIMHNQQLEIDTSHFFWLVTYFLKFATQIELDLEHVRFVLSFDIISYITAEGINICEQFELAVKLDGSDLKPSMRRLHLVVTAIREFMQAIEAYKKSTQVSDVDHQSLLDLQMKMCETDELRLLMVLLMRYYDPNYQSKQYLQDIVVTNHLLLMFMDGLLKSPEYRGNSNMVDHVRQFANKHMMYQYGLILEDYESNGEFVNDCVFTVLHHVAGELDALNTLFQPKIIQTFNSLWKSDFELCDDWSDLVEYVINTFVKKPASSSSDAAYSVGAECLDEDIIAVEGPKSIQEAPQPEPDKSKSVNNNKNSKNRWTDDEMSSLSWIYIQCKTLPDVVEEIVKLFKDDGITKSRKSVIRQLLKQGLISREEFDHHMNVEMDSDYTPPTPEMRESEIRKLCEQLVQDDKTKYVDWVQAVLLEICYVKIYLNKKAAGIATNSTNTNKGVNGGPGTKKKKIYEYVLSPVSYHSLHSKQPVPLVPWNCDQAEVCKDLKFLYLLNKLGFHMPVDTGKVFIRIPNNWTADILYEVAAKISPITASKLKFSVKDLSKSSLQNIGRNSTCNAPMHFTKDVPVDNFYHIHRPKHLTSAVNYTPMPSSYFNSSNDEMNKMSWLEVVQKSQQYKLNVNEQAASLPVNDDDVEMTTMEQCEAMAAVARPTALPDKFLSPSVISIKHQTSYSVYVESDGNISLCDTASVASDLTRMYVSDEEDKEDMLSEPRASCIHPVLADTRPRVKFAPTF